MAVAQSALRGWQKPLVPSSVQVGYVLIIIIIFPLGQEDDAAPFPGLLDFRF
jgi:hypothetical protein